MTARRRGLALGAAVAAGAACVRIDAGPNGVAATRLADIPPSIVRGDALRDANGAVTTLNAVAFDESGRPIATAPLRFFYLPGLGDTSATARRDSALVVDSATGAVQASDTTSRTQGVVAVRVGDAIQLLDTLLIVRRPTAVADTVPAVDTLRYDCTDDRIAVAADTGNAAARFNASRAFGVTVLGDSAGVLVAVPSRLVRWTVVSPLVPPTRLPGGTERDTVATITVVDSVSGARQVLDTTSSVGRSAVRLRIRPTGLGRDVLARPDTVVILEGVAQRGSAAVRGSPFRVRVPISRRPLSAETASAACQ